MAIIELRTRWRQDHDGARSVGKVRCTLQPFRPDGHWDERLGKEAFRRLRLPYGVIWYGEQGPPPPFTVYGPPDFLTVQVGLGLQAQLTAEMGRLHALEEDIATLKSAREQ